MDGICGEAGPEKSEPLPCPMEHEASVSIDYESLRRIVRREHALVCLDIRIGTEYNGFPGLCPHAMLRILTICKFS